MSNKTSEITKKKSAFYSDDELYTAEHKKDIEKFNRLLEKMKETEKNAADKKALIELNETIHSFEKYIMTNRLVLSGSEKKELAAITGSNLTPVVIKRMAEDLIYRIKQRIEKSLAEENENKKFKEEINLLHSSGGGIIAWFRLFRFSISYGTITPFSHRLKAASLSIIRENAFFWQQSIIKYIQDVLDRDYYILSTIEYNTLLLIKKLNTPIEKIKAIPFEDSYDSDSISSQMDNFTEIYCILKKNFSIADEGLNHAIKRKKPPHGLLGYFYSLMSIPLLNQKPKKLTDFEKLNETIEGTLYSYYTTRQKTIVTTLNQLVYLTGADIEIDTIRKNLTDAAIDHEKNTRQKENSENTQILKKYDELDRILNTYLKKGEDLLELILQYEGGSAYKHWQKEHLRKPFLKIKRIIDAYIKHFLEPLKTENIFVPLFQGKEYPGYIQKFKALKSSIDGFTLFDLDLVGTKEREFVSVKLPEGTDSDEFLNYITGKDLLPNVHEQSLITAKSMLANIASKSYDIALRLNDIITGYLNRREIIDADPTANYDFLTTAYLKRNNLLKCRFIVRDNEIYLEDFFQAASALAFYFSAKLSHEGIDAMRKDFDKVKNLRNQISNSSASSDGDDNDEIPEEGIDSIDTSLVEELNNKYKDSITGLWREEYLDDHVLPVLYDNSFNYISDTPRTVFFAQINGITNFNKTHGYENGDRFLKKICSQFIESLNSSSFSKDDILIKKEGPAIVGYLNNMDFTTIVELIQQIQKKILALSEEFVPGDNTGVYTNAGIYKEKRGTNFRNNVEVAAALMNAAMKKGPGRTAFLRNPDSIMNPNDVDRFGEVNPELITIL